MRYVRDPAPASSREPRLTHSGHTPAHTILREVRVVGAHNAYHIGEFAILREVMGTWPAGRQE